MGSAHRRSAPIERLESISANKQIWLTLDDGRLLSGRMVANGSPDSVSLECALPSSSTSAFTGPDQRQTVARRSIRRLEVQRASYSYAGLFLGACMDAAVFRLIWVSLDHSWDPGMGAARQGAP